MTRQPTFDARQQLNERTQARVAVLNERLRETLNEAIYTQLHEKGLDIVARAEHVQKQLVAGGDAGVDVLFSLPVGSHLHLSEKVGTGPNISDFQYAQSNLFALEQHPKTRQPVLSNPERAAQQVTELTAVRTLTAHLTSTPYRLTIRESADQTALEGVLEPVGEI